MVIASQSVPWELQRAIREEAAKDAELVLGETWADRVLPVDPYVIGAALGYEIRVARFARAGVSGAASRPANGGHSRIFLSVTDADVRSRFTCAHEIGHLWRHRKQLDREVDRVDFRSSLSSRETDPEEMYANAFAACVLMPKRETLAVFEELGSIVTIENIRSMAQRFFVSEQAMQYRLERLVVNTDG